MRIAATFCLVYSFLFSSFSVAQSSIEKLTTSINGTIISSEPNPLAMVSSENGQYWCTYEINAVTDEMRELSNLKLYQDDSLILNLSKVPGSDLSITNSGRLVFYDHSEHFNGILKINSFSKEGNFLFEKTFSNADLFEFSTSDEKMGVRTKDGISIISLSNGSSYTVQKGMQIAFDADEEYLAVVQSNKILIYKNSSLTQTIETGIELPRKVIISAANDLVGVIDKYTLKDFSINNQNLIFEDNSQGVLSFRDLKIVDSKIIAGIHKRTKTESTGILRIYDLNGDRLDEQSGESKPLQKFEKLNLEKKSQINYNPIPWPFFPFDSMRTVWNHYEQHMGSNPSSSYLHQGLDLITPIGEPTYAVIDGYVKLVLTIGGDSYWRTAISDTQIAGRSDGWLSAHLIQSTIQFDIGDTVQVHDYLGDIIQWSSNWGHIHFVNISDSGLVWYYNDGEWGINFNPILALQPYPDTTPPYIDPVFPWSKFAFAVNESATYLQPDSLFGEIDIIVKVVDYVGDSEWQQPAYTTWYSVKRISDGQIIKPKTLGHILNHKFPFYEGGNYVPYAGVIYQRDNTLQPSSWMDTERNYYHNLTNSNGDSLVDLSEKTLAFDTDNYQDGDYRIIVEVYDEVGNFDIDSMDVKFKNGNPVTTESEDGKIYTFNLDQNYPNPFNPTTKIKFNIPSVIASRAKQSQLVVLKVYDILGKEVTTLVNEELPAGEYEVDFDGANLTSGIYFYELKAGSFIQTKKMVYLK
jgi:hypothetical protein